MNTLIMTFCILGIVFSVVSSLMDISRFKKEFRLVFTTILIVALVKPILSLDVSFLDDISLEDSPYDVEDDTYLQEYTYEAIQSEVESSIQTFLEEKGILCKNILVNINITDDSCISINKVTISTDDFQRAKQVLTENFGDNITVSEW
ncbi:MAG: hypothetical protein LIO71_06395 [Ruminococcus sp.]|nr:hypothetical protein [Ruminococcus sp.]MCD7800700.1 hypothetical protein [Ruminococcus sp.]